MAAPAHPLLVSSRAPAALTRIIAIISTVPPPPQPGPGSTFNRGPTFGFDLNLGFKQEPTSCVDFVDAADTPDQPGTVSISEKKADALNSGEALTADKSSQGECDPEGSQGKAPPNFQEGGGGGDNQTSETTSIPEKRNAREGYLDLLLEAVRQVSGELLDDDQRANKEAETAKKRFRQPNKERGACCTSPLDLHYDDEGGRRSVEAREESGTAVEVPRLRPRAMEEEDAHSRPLQSAAKRR